MRRRGWKRARGAALARWKQRNGTRRILLDMYREVYAKSIEAMAKQRSWFLSCGPTVLVVSPQQAARMRWLERTRRPTLAERAIAGKASA